MVLCYVYNGIAYFTPKSLEEQWGDDWDDAPLEHNAGEPNDVDQCILVAFIGPFESPGDAPSHGWSVEQVNRRAAPWLKCWGNNARLYAGATVDEFKGWVRANGGRVFVEEES